MANGSQKTSFPQQDPFKGKSPKTSKNARFKICPLCKPQNPLVIVGIEPSHNYHTLGLLGLLGTPPWAIWATLAMPPAARQSAA